VLETPRHRQARSLTRTANALTEPALPSETPLDFLFTRSHGL
jgi:hypothetical protein